MTNGEIKDLDWGLLWQRAKEKKSWRSKGPADWDKKAVSFARRTSRSIYTEKFLDLLNPDPAWSVLDVGCGPGTLALPLAARTRWVTAIDFSANMLEILKKKAADQGVGNITALKLSWLDDWRGNGVGCHDLAIASRSLSVPDLKKALSLLTGHASQKVVVTDRVQHGPFDPDAFKAVGRPLNTGPDYIYTVNLLYQMGYLPTVDYIRLEETLDYSSLSEALSSYTWMFRDLAKEEEERLTRYVLSITTEAEDGTVSVHRRHVPTWAYISWQPDLVVKSSGKSMQSFVQ